MKSLHEDENGASDAQRKNPLSHRAIQIKAIDKDPPWFTMTDGNFISKKVPLEFLRERLDDGMPINDPNAIESLLHWASRIGRLDIVEEALRRGAAIRKDLVNERTPLYWAARHGHLDVVEALLSHGTKINMDSTTEAVDNALFWTTQYYQSGEIKEYINLKSFVNAGDTVTNINSSILISMMKALLSHGAKVNAVNKNGETCLHWASHEGHLDVMKELIDQGAIVDAVNNKGWTPLYVSIKSEHSNERVAQLLLDSGADIRLRTKDGHNARALSILHNNKYKALLAKHELVIRCFGKDMIPNLAKNPKTVQYLADAALFVKLQNIQRHPPDFRKYENDPRVLAALFALDKITKANFSQSTTLGDRSDIDSAVSVQEEVYTIHSAIELIHQYIQSIKEIDSNLAHQATGILSMSLNFKTNRQRVLNIAVSVGHIIDQLFEFGIPNDVSSLLQTLTDIQNYWQSTLEMTKSWKLFTHDDDRLVCIQSITTNITRLQDLLFHDAKSLNIDLKVQVVGNVLDSTVGIQSMMKTMHSLNESLASIARIPRMREQTDKLLELAIQIERGLEHYQRQVNFGNIERNHEFETHTKSCQYKIEKTSKGIYQTNKIRYDINKIESWMLSSDDVHFDPDNIKSGLGRGGFATVYRGMYYGQEVAVKRFDQIVMADSTDLENLIVKEVKAWKDVSHEPYILTLIGVCTKVPVPILVCELCDTNIRRYVRDRQETLIGTVFQFACGLLSLHNAGIIHRDLKGDNVLITFRNTVAIADFGLSRTVVSFENAKTGATRSGTLNWMSPEQYLTPQHVTTKSDIWSFGMTLWEVLCNDIPFKDYGFYEIPDALQSEDERPEIPINLASHLEPLWSLITMCWRKDPTARPSAVEIVDFLERHYSSELELILL
ncbi:hypothetical protein LEN26_002306 [Aphanomyces euteiches]|nr:hypothetical protein LEN26_002306 [Aphanomyces euteiches]